MGPLGVFLCSPLYFRDPLGVVLGGLSPPPPPQSKGGILSKACDYVRELRQSNQRLQEAFKEAERLQMDNDLLRQQAGPAPALSPAPRHAP